MMSGRRWISSAVLSTMFESFYGQTQLSNSSSTGERAWTFSPVIESGWNDNFPSLRATLPGVSEKDVHVTERNNQLVIEGERKHPEELQKNGFTQMAYGKFYAAITLP